MSMLSNAVQRPPDSPAAPRELTYSEAVREALAQAMAADSRVFLFGEDVGVYGGAFGVSGDLVHKFGESRVIDTPISELGMAGAAVGAAIDRHEAGARNSIFGFCHAGDGNNRQSGSENSFHVRRQGFGADGGAFTGRLRHGRGGPAFAIAGSVVCPCAGVESGAAFNTV